MGVAARFARVTFKPDEEGRIPFRKFARRTTPGARASSARHCQITKSAGH